MMTFNCFRKLMLGGMTFLFALAVGISPAAAQTITFGTGSSQPPSYTESGLTVSAVPGGHLHVEDRNLDGDTDLMCHSGAGGVSNNYTFDMGGALFTVISLDFSGEAVTPGGGIFPLGTNTFTSSSGATQNPTAPGTITFPAAGWTDITSFSWSTTASAVIDNLVVVELVDTDGDGIFDDEDECVDSDLSATVVILDCDSGVENQLFPNGCTISDLIAECAAESNNHGQFVRCVAHLTNDLKKAGLITGKEKGKIQSCAAKAKP